jgi:ADP-ribosyl-[dinitrogen reductase] hydrolase
MKHPNPDMLLRIAQGDAYGMSCEYLKHPRDDEVRELALEFKRYGVHPVHKIKPGHYTDDTQMSIAVAEILASWGRQGPGPGSLEHLFADAFVRCYLRDKRDGYSKGLKGVLDQCSDGEDLLRLADRTSDKNGAAMRSVPIGVIDDPDLVARVASRQAGVTHHAGGVSASVSVALMSHFALHCDAPLSELPFWIGERMVAGTPWRWSGRPVREPNVGMATASAVLTLVSEEKSLVDIARRAIEWGGDVDSVLAIAWGIASARMREPLPEFFDSGLENGAYGRDFLRGLGGRLMDSFS